MTIVSALFVSLTVLAAPATPGPSHQVIQNVYVFDQPNFDWEQWHDVHPVHAEKALVPPPEPQPVVMPKPVPIPLITVRFDTGKWKLNAEQKQVLAATLPVEGWEYTVEGSADPRGTKKYNQKLAQNRAESLEAWLRQNGYQVGLVANSGAHQVPPKDWARVRQTQILGIRVFPGKAAM